MQRQLRFKTRLAAALNRQTTSRSTRRLSDLARHDAQRKPPLWGELGL